MIFKENNFLWAIAILFLINAFSLAFATETQKLEKTVRDIRKMDDLINPDGRDEIDCWTAGFNTTCTCSDAKDGTYACDSFTVNCVETGGTATSTSDGVKCVW